MLTFLSMNGGMVVEIRQAGRCPVFPLVVAMTLGLIGMTPVCVRRRCQRRIGQTGLTGMRPHPGMPATETTATGGRAGGTTTTATCRGTTAGTAGAARAHETEATTLAGAAMRAVDAASSAKLVERVVAIAAAAPGRSRLMPLTADAPGVTSACVLDRHETLKQA